MYNMYVWLVSEQKGQFEKAASQKHTRSHRYEEDAAQQGAGESRFDDLCIALVSCAVTLQQSCDVEGHLRNRAERGVYYRSHCKVTLCGNTTEKTRFYMKNKQYNKIYKLEQVHINRFKCYLAIPIPMQ